MSITPRCLVLFLAIAMCLVYETLGQQPKEISNSIGMKMVFIPKGTFMKGAPTSEEGRKDDEVQHEVTITRDFYLGAYEVTQSQYKRIMGSNPSRFQGQGGVVRRERIFARYDPLEGKWVAAGGSYDGATGRFTAAVDRPGTYAVLMLERYYLLLPLVVVTQPSSVPPFVSSTLPRVVRL